MSIQCTDRRSGIDRRQSVVDEKCSTHDQCEKMYDFRFGTQDEKIDKLERIIETLANNIRTMEGYFKVCIGFMAAIQFLQSDFWHKFVSLFKF